MGMNCSMRIRFGEMAHAEFQHRFRMYTGLFSEEEFRDITMMITSKDLRAEKFNRRPHLVKRTPEPVCVESKIAETIHLNWYRGYFEEGPLKVTTGVFLTTFTSTSQLFLKQVTMDSSIFARVITIYEDGTDKSSGLLVAFKENISRQIEFSPPILIKANIRYSIEPLVRHEDYCFFNRLKKTVKRSDGTIIDFGDYNEIIRTLYFDKCIKGNNN